MRIHLIKQEALCLCTRARLVYSLDFLEGHFETRFTEFTTVAKFIVFPLPYQFGVHLRKGMRVVRSIGRHVVFPQNDKTLSHVELTVSSLPLEKAGRPPPKIVIEEFL